MSFVDKHKSMLTRIRSRGGVEVAFFRQSASYDSLTDTRSSPEDERVRGFALATANDAKTFAELNLTAIHALTILFVPNQYGEMPELLDKIVWGGKTRTVRRIDPVAPDGVPIGGDVIIE